MELIVLYSNREQSYNAEDFDITENTTDTQILDKMKDALNEISEGSEVPFAVKRTVRDRTTVGEEGVDQEEEQVIYLIPSPVAGE